MMRPICSQLMPEEHSSRHDEYLRAYLTTGKAKVIGTGREVSALLKDAHSAACTWPDELVVEWARGGTRGALCSRAMTRVE